MVYVMTGLCGDFDSYKSLIGKIKLKKNDDLYIVGNILCPKAGGIDILFDAMNAENIFPIAGKGEIDAAKFLRAIRKPEVKPDSALREEMAAWFSRGGFACANAFMSLESDEKKDYILEYLSDEFTLVEEIETDNKQFIISAKGLGGFSLDKDISDYSAKELTSGNFDPTCDGYKDDGKYIICGDLDDFTPTEGYEGKIYKTGNVIILNHAENKRPCCLRLEDMKEYYV